MSEDKRVSRDFHEQAKSDPLGTERWADYLDWVREDIIRVVVSLPQEEQRTSRIPSGWAPIEFLGHVFHIEHAGSSGASSGSRWTNLGAIGTHLSRGPE